MNEKWKSLRLGECFKIKHGWAFKGEFFAQKGKYILLTPGNFKPDGGIKLKGDKEKYYAGDFPKEFLLKFGDFLVVMTDLTQEAPILGSSAIIRENDKFLHNQRLGKIVNLDEAEMSRAFLYHLFNSSSVKNQIKATATGATVKHTAPDRIYNVVVSLPPLPTQRKIAAILSAYDGLIENNTRRIKILEDMAATLYRQWFIEIRFPGHENAPMVESSLGLIPRGWEVKSFGEVSQNFDRQRKPLSAMSRSTMQGDYPYYGAAKILDYINGYLFDGRYLLIAEDGSVITDGGNPVLQLVSGKFWVNNHAHIVQGRHPISTNFLYLFMSNVAISSYITGTAQPKINQQNLNRIPIISPPQSLLERFNRIIQPIFDEIVTLDKKNANLRQTRDLLLPKLISGEIDVSELEVEIEGVQPRKGKTHIPPSLNNRLHSDPKILGGKPIIRGTRIAVELILELIEHGWKTEQIFENYPNVTHEDINACLAYQQR